MLDAATRDRLEPTLASRELAGAPLVQASLGGLPFSPGSLRYAAPMGRRRWPRHRAHAVGALVRSTRCVGHRCL